MHACIENMALMDLHMYHSTHNNIIMLKYECASTQSTHAKAKQEELNREDPNRAFDAQKGRKDGKLSSTKTLYTYREDGKKESI